MKEKTLNIKVCPECKSNVFVNDEIHKETYCLRCGLIIKAPYTTDFIASGFAKLKIKIFDITLN